LALVNGLLLLGRLDICLGIATMSSFRVAPH
jgi:hypothetical protein